MKGSSSKNWPFGIATAAVIAVAGGLWAARQKAAIPSLVLKVPTGGVYLGVFPDFPEVPDHRWKEKITGFENLIGKKVAWVTVMNDFADGPIFPKVAVQEVMSAGTVPFIRVLPRSERVQGKGAEPIYSLERIYQGAFDRELRQWCRDAAAVKAPLLIEFAQEANGDWYGWGGSLNGADQHTLSSDLPDGPHRFQLAHRHFVDLCRSEGARNLTWFFHMDSQPRPQVAWNSMEAYYPGDDYVDWVGLSVYGAQYPTDYWATFNEGLEPAYRELCNVTQAKPLALLEVGVIENPKDPNGKAQWFNDALVSLLTHQYPRIKAFNYWNESSWTETGDNNFRVDSSPAALKVFRDLIADPFFVGKAEF